VPEGAFDAFHLRGELPMNARAQPKPDFDGLEDRQLADDIASVMHHRPLLSRLARVESSHAAAAGFVANLAPQADDEAVGAAAAPAEIDPRSIEEVIDDLPNIVSSPPSARWLENARQEHRRARTRHAVAWVTTLGIASTIILFALLLLRA
jgi:hypothetical protein